MADGPSTQVNIKFENDLFLLVEDYRRKLTPIPSRSEAIKALVRNGLRCIEAQAQAAPDPPAAS